MSHPLGPTRTDVWGHSGPHPTRACLSPTSPSQPPTFLHHAYGQALLEAAELAAVAPPLVHRAVLVSQADVLGVFLHCALDGGTSRNRLSERGGGWGGSPGEGTVQILLPSQTKALSVRSYFSNIWVAGEGEMARGGADGGEEKENLGDTRGGFCLRRETPRTQD